MLVKYLTAAMHRARYEKLKNGKYYGEIPSCQGVYATADTLEDCREELEEVLEEWILFRVHRRLEIPAIHGVKLAVKGAA
jgi:predicted RNase H-like HicB family nuclease